MDRYVNWSSTALAKNDFYTDWKCRQMYKAHLKVFTHRINTVNGRMYKEDPTIFFWDLMNEPRWCGPAAKYYVEKSLTCGIVLMKHMSHLCHKRVQVFDCSASDLVDSVLHRLPCLQVDETLKADVDLCCSTGCGFALQAWVEEMALYLKAIDPNHLVTIGEEGFYSTTCDRFAPLSSASTLCVLCNNCNATCCVPVCFF